MKAIYDFWEFFNFFLGIVGALRPFRFTVFAFGAFPFPVPSGVLGLLLELLLE